VVLGSSQAIDLVAAPAARRTGYTVLRRRGGGGMVHLPPGEVLCADVWLPADDQLWLDDVEVSSLWLGEVWAAALGRLGLVDLEVHRRTLRRGGAAREACFAGVGPGEVTAGGRKVVGMSQWRCRQGSLHSCALYHRWRPEVLVDLMAGPGAPRPALLEELGSCAVGIDELAGEAVPDARIHEAFWASLPATPRGWRSLPI
jgi:lipoate---protein ligase